MAKFKVTVSTPKLGSSHSNVVEIDDEDMEFMSEQDIENEMMEKMLQIISWDYKKVE